MGSVGEREERGWGCGAGGGRGEQLAETFEAGVDEEADVGDGEAGGGGDFLVGEVVLEFEAEALGLVGGEPLKVAEDIGGVVAGGDGVGGFRGGGGELGEGIGVETDDAVAAAEPVEGAVAADRVEPWFEAWAVEAGWVFVDPEFEERVLDDVASGVVVVGDAGGVADERPFELGQGALHEFGAELAGIGDGVHGSGTRWGGVRRWRVDDWAGGNPGENRGAGRIRRVLRIPMLWSRGRGCRGRSHRA